MMEARLLQNGDVVCTPKEHGGFGRVCGVGFFAADLMYDDGICADGVPEDDINPINLDEYIMFSLGFSPSMPLFGRRAWINKSLPVIRLMQCRKSGRYYTTLLGKKMYVETVDQLQRLIRNAGYPWLANTIFTQ